MRGQVLSGTAELVGKREQMRREQREYYECGMWDENWRNPAPCWQMVQSLSPARDQHTDAAGLTADGHPIGAPKKHKQPRKRCTLP